MEFAFARDHVCNVQHWHQRKREREREKKEKGKKEKKKKKKIHTLHFERGIHERLARTYFISYHTLIIATLLVDLATLESRSISRAA